MRKDITEVELTHLIKKLDLDPDRKEATLLHETSAKAEQSLTRDGWARVKDQTIIVQDPEGDGKPPVIQSVAPVKLIINDRIVESECTVSSADRIGWEIDEQALFEIKISEDKIYAYFRLNAIQRFAWRLVHTGPMNNLVIIAEENRDVVVETVRLSDVVARIETMRITSNLDIAAIQKELAAPTYRPVLIAKGRAAVPGRDAQLEIYFSEQVKSRFFEVSGSIDYRNHLQIPTVDSGELIARKTPLVEGLPGYDVYGNVILPAQSKDVVIVIKPGVEMTSDGEIKALKAGRPRIMGGSIKTFDISTAFIVSGNVDIETGNIVFSGDVIVYGNVTDNMIIESLGNVYVYGSVYNSTITATGSIYVRGNILGSKLYCGYFGVLFNRLYNTSKMLDESIEKLLAASKILLQVLEKKQQRVRFGQIVILLIENKFTEIPNTINELLTVISNIQHLKKEENNRLQHVLEVFTSPTKLIELASPSFIQMAHSLLRETHEEMARLQEDHTEIRFNQCHNSEIKSNGDILVLREGVILSDLYAANDIAFRHETAVCRGSRLEAGGGIHAKIIGGETGVSTLLTAKRKVTVKKMYFGRICIGKYCIDIDHIVENQTFDIQHMKNPAF